MISACFPIAAIPQREWLHNGEQLFVTFQLQKLTKLPKCSLFYCGNIAKNMTLTYCNLVTVLTLKSNLTSGLARNNFTLLMTHG